MLKQDPGLVTVGKITTVYGVKGWLKVHSYTDPIDNILDYRHWQLIGKGEQTARRVTIDDGRRHNNGIVVHIEGIDDRETARALAQFDICIDRAEMPALDEGDYYWHQLEGLDVYSGDSPGRQSAGKYLGKLAYMMETGANDVMVVQPVDLDKDTKDTKGDELLIPFLPGRVVRNVDLEQGIIVVDWQEPV